VSRIDAGGSAAQSTRAELQRAEGFLDGKSPALVFGLGLVFVIVVGILDWLTGQALSLALFYLMPIGLVTWNLGRRAGIAGSIVSMAAGFAADVVGTGATHDLLPYWNGLVRFAVYAVFVQLLSTLHDSLDVHRLRADHEQEVSLGLRELNDVKDTLLHAVSHDLKGPLAGVIGAMQTLRRGSELQLTEDEVESLYQMIEASGRKMNRLVDDMLDLERLDRGQVHPEREPTDVGDLARRVAREAPGIDTHPVRIDADPVLVDVDPGKVERIIENLLVNAARHTQTGTPVHIRVREQPKGILLTIEDEGPGIPEELKGVLFDPFRQGPNAAGRGVGIGLSLVKRFAELHGGTAVIEDHEGGGARFVITLPGHVSPAQAADATSPEQSHLRAV
jgi:signal transduction histidine kinase